MNADEPVRITTRLLLVRHGESNATVEQRLAGMGTDTGLSPLGRDQAKRLAERFTAGHEPGVDAIWSSPVPRARQTAEFVREVLGLPVSEDPELEEHRPGEADGMRFVDVTARYGEPPAPGAHYEPWLPGGESRAAFAYRIGVTVHRLVDAHPGMTLLVVCHGGVIDTAVRQLLGLPGDGFDLWALNTSITELVARHRADRHPGRWQLVRFNDAAHLAGLPPQTL
jgi:broad specificity phosphatase PhoE